VIGCLISGCSLFGGDSQADGTLQTAKVGQTQVTARVTDGTVAGAELTPLQGALATVTPLAPPVKLEVKGGQLEGEATLRTKVPDNLPTGVATEAVGYLTKHEPSGAWLWLGGDYDSKSRTVSIQTPHFSEWVLGGTKPEDILTKLEGTDYRTFIGDEVATLIAGNPPKLSCSKTGATPETADDIQPLVDVLVSDSLPPGVEACMGVDENGYFNLELVNPHAMPIRLELPEGVTVRTELFRDEGFLQIANSKLRQKLTEDVILHPESKIRLQVVPNVVSDSSVITGEFDMMTFLFNSTMFLTEAVLDGRELERILGRKHPDSIESGYERYANNVDRYADTAECIRRLAAEAEAKGYGGNIAAMAWEYQEQAFKDCTHVTLEGTAQELSKKTGHPIRRIASGLLRRLDTS
jgi:hypothetical protein